MDANFLTALSIFVATATWLLTQRSEQKAERARHTVATLAYIHTNERLGEARFQVTRLIDSGMTVSRASVDTALEAHIVDMLDYYEFISELYLIGELSKPTVDTLRGRLMRRTWDVCKEYIEETRKLQGRRIYSSLEQYVTNLDLAN